MEFLDLENLSIIPESSKEDLISFRSKEITIVEEDLQMPLSKFNAKLIEDLASLFENLQKDRKIQFQITLNCQSIHYEADDLDLIESDFLSLVQQINSIIFQKIITEERRDREARLDVPEELKKKINVSLNWLKKALNYKTLIDKLNIFIIGKFFDTPPSLYIYNLTDSGKE